MEEIQDKVNYYSTNIANEICEMPSFDMENIRQIIKARMLFAVRELYDFGLAPMQEHRNKLAEEYRNEATPVWRKKILQSELSGLTEKIKVFNRVTHTVRNIDEYNALKNFIRDKGQDGLLKEFYKTLKK